MNSPKIIDLGCSSQIKITIGAKHKVEKAGLKKSVFFLKLNKRRMDVASIRPMYV
jgi:hypothetical protein